MMMINATSSINQELSYKFLYDISYKNLYDKILIFLYVIYQMLSEEELDAQHITAPVYHIPCVQYVKCRFDILCKLLPLDICELVALFITPNIHASPLGYLLDNQQYGYNANMKICTRSSLRANHISVFLFQPFDVYIIRDIVYLVYVKQLKNKKVIIHFIEYDTQQIIQRQVECVFTQYIILANAIYFYYIDQVTDVYRFDKDFNLFHYYTIHSLPMPDSILLISDISGWHSMIYRNMVVALTTHRIKFCTSSRILHQIDIRCTRSAQLFERAGMLHVEDEDNQWCFKWPKNNLWADIQVTRQPRQPRHA